MRLQRIPVEANMGRRAHQPDPSQRKQVETMAGLGITEPDIALLLEIDPKTLRKHYRRELEIGHVKANAKISSNLFRMASGSGREAATCAIFWCKTRLGWRERFDHEHAGQGGGPLQIVISPTDAKL
jgi:hypothetical protein